MRRTTRSLLFLLALPLLAGISNGQSGSPWSGVRPPGSAPGSAPVSVPGAGTASRPATPRPPAPADTALVARVAGRPITRVAYDQLAEPYFARLRAQYGPAFSPEIQKIGRLNVLKELVRREVLAIEAQRQKVAVTDAEVDSMLMRDAFFLTNGKFDPLKFSQFKMSPGSNYRQVLPQVREAAAVDKLDRAIRRRLEPTPAAVRAEWSKRMDQVTFQYFPLLLRDVSLEPESTEEDWAAHYRDHPRDYERKGQLRLRAHRIALPPAGDSTRAAAETAALSRGKQIADSLTAGTLPDSTDGTIDTGLFDVPATTVPALGPIPGLLAELGRADTVSSIRVVGPFAGTDAVVVGAIVERKPRHVPPLREVLAQVKRRADVEKRQAAVEAERRAYYDAHPDSFRGPRVVVTRLTLTGATSLEASAAKIAEGLAKRRNPRDLARANGAAAETLTLLRGDRPDTLFPSFFVDSLLASGPARKGAVEGPRRFGARVAVWRVDQADTSFLPSFDQARDRAGRKVSDERRAREETEGRAWFEGHRDRYKVPPLRQIDYVSVAIPPPDSVRIPDADLRAAYEKEKPRFAQAEQLKARHILLKAGPGLTEAQAQARAESLRTAASGGADFADLARRFSHEPGASTSGGDLGWFGRGRMVKEFEAAAFAMAPGDISPVVKTTFGYHVIRLEEKKAAGTKPFEEVRKELRDRIATERADSTAVRTARALRRALARGGKTDSLALPHGGVQTPSPFGAADAVPGVGMVPGLPEALAATPTGTWLSRPFRAGRGYLVARTRSVLPERPAEFDDVRGRAIEDAKTAKREALLESKVAAIRSALQAGAALDSLAAPYGGVRNGGSVARSGTFVSGLGVEPRVIAKAFALKEGEWSDTLVTAQGRVWVRAQSRTKSDPKAFAAARPAIAAEMLQRSLDEWLEARKKTLRVEVLRRDLREAEPGAVAGR